MDDARYAKRARQACEPCRRKKSKCPGERPACSYCERLRQPCVYYDPGDAIDRNKSMQYNMMETRLNSLEGKMNRLTQRLSDGQTSPQPGPSTCQTISPVSSVHAHESSWIAAPEASTINVRSWTAYSASETGLLEMGRLYLTWCHNQPITLFSADTLLESLSSRTAELILAMESLSLRFPPGSLTAETEKILEAKARAARKVVMDRITDGRIELSTMQSMCLLSIFDFTSGNFSQSRLNLMILSHLAHDISSAGENSQEKQYCLKAIYLLQQLQGCIERPTRLMSAMTDLRIGADTFSIVASCAGPDAISSDLSEKPISIVATTFCSAWQMARAYAACHPAPGSPPPWDSRSDYSSVLQSHLNIDCQIPPKYRFHKNKIDDYSSETLQKDRQWWMPFLFIQFVYSAIPCLLNHPFLLSMRLRNFRQTIPQTFIQQSFESITRNAGWIIYFIGVLESKALDVSDPCLAHCVVIVATIHLQHSFVSDPQVRNRAQAEFDKCMGFIRRMATMWPTVAVMADNLKRLQDSVVSVSTPQDPTNTAPRSFSIDSQLLWDLLIYDKAGRADAGQDRAHTGMSRDSEGPIRSAQDRADDFDLVGSVGISGHKAVQKEAEPYAPSGDSPAPDVNVPNPVLVDMGISFEDMYVHGIGSHGEQGDIFLQANDYGRAIDNWLDLESRGGL